MKKLSNRLSVKQSSTKEGQRELLREHTNKINEIIDVLEKNPRLVYVFEEKSYTAMRSTGEPMTLTCFSIDCPERKSICCGAVSKAVTADLLHDLGR